MHVLFLLISGINNTIHVSILLLPSSFLSLFYLIVAVCISGQVPNSKNETFDRPKNDVKHLSYGDLLEQRQKGLCFKCGGVYSPQHICLDKHLNIMLTNELDDSESTTYLS